MDRQLCIAALQHISVDVPLERGERLTSDIRLTNDQRIVESLLGAETVAIFGVLETTAIKESSMVAYSVVDVDTPASSDEANRAVLAFLRDLKLFQVALWLVKDNAASFENALLERPHGARGALRHINQWDGICTDAIGTRTHTVFSREEFRTARHLHNTLWLKDEEAEDATGLAERLGASEPTEPESGRNGRAIYFLQGARNAGALSLKVAHYCSAFEALLSTDTSELSHKLAERLGWLLGSTPAERLPIFRTLKASYGIRSSAVHGGSLSKKKIKDDLSRASRDCDDLLRRLLLRILSSNDLRALYLKRDVPPALLEEKLLELCLGIWCPNHDAD